MSDDELREWLSIRLANVDELEEVVDKFRGLTRSQMEQEYEDLHPAPHYD